MMFCDANRRTSTAKAIKCSVYAKKLVGAAKSRYIKKISLINGLDPFVISSSGIEKQPLPPIEASDLASYLVLQTSFVSARQFKVHKSMEAYNQFVSGWVKDISAWNINGKSVITGRESSIGCIIFYFTSLFLFASSLSAAMKHHSPVGSFVNQVVKYAVHTVPAWPA